MNPQQLSSSFGFCILWILKRMTVLRSCSNYIFVCSPSFLLLSFFFIWKISSCHPIFVVSRRFHIICILFVRQDKDASLFHMLLRFVSPNLFASLHQLHCLLRLLSCLWLALNSTNQECALLHHSFWCRILNSWQSLSNKWIMILLKKSDVEALLVARLA